MTLGWKCQEKSSRAFYPNHTYKHHTTQTNSTQPWPIDSHEIPVIRASSLLKWCSSSSLQQPGTDRHIPQITATFSVSNAGLTSPAKPKCPVKSDVTSGHRPSRKSCRKPCSPAQLGRVQSSSSGVAVAVCGMEEQCVCTAAGWDFSILKCRQAADDTAFAARRAACLTAWRYSGLSPRFPPRQTSFSHLRLRAWRHLWGLVIFAQRKRLLQVWSHTSSY